MVVFPRFHAVPFSKILTFFRRDNFGVAAVYDGNVPVMDPHIGNFEVGDVKPLEDGSNQKVKVKIRINLHGIFVVSSANYSEKHEIEEEVQMEVDPPKEEGEKKEGEPPAGDKTEAKPEADAEMKDAAEPPKAEAEAPKKEMKTEKRKKIITKTIDLPVTSIVVGAMSRDKLEASFSQEKNLSNQDTYESNRLVAKNSVEEYIYSIREKMCEELEQYILEADREAYSQKLTETEDWLYEDGEDCEKAVYEDKLKELKLVGEAAKKRKTEFEGRKKAMDMLGLSLQLANKVVEMYKAGDEKYSHLTDAEIEKVTKCIEEKAQWLNNSIATLEKTPKTANPTILCCQFYSEKDAFEAITKPILTKAKPKVEPPKEEPKKESSEANAEADKKSSKEASNNGEAMDEGVTVNGNNEQKMDLD